MTEKDFWMFLNSALERGREPQVSGMVDSNDPQLKKVGRFIGSPSFLPKGYDKISTEEITNMGRLLLRGMASISTREVILVLLAHHPSREALDILRAYNEQPDEEVKIFAQLALQECEMWNEGQASNIDSGPNQAHRPELCY